jgi:hypothetical protein
MARLIARSSSQTLHVAQQAGEFLGRHRGMKQDEMLRIIAYVRTLDK